jgi:Ca2+-dependent lipid-binding protein
VSDVKAELLGQELRAKALSKSIASAQAADIHHKMPGKVKVKIIAGRNLPVMDRSADTTDAYVEIKLANITHKTDVCRKTLNPQWTEELHRFEVRILQNHTSGVF